MPILVGYLLLMNGHQLRAHEVGTPQHPYILLTNGHRHLVVLGVQGNQARPRVVRAVVARVVRVAHQVQARAHPRERVESQALIVHLGKLLRGEAGVSSRVMSTIYT